MFLNKMKMMIKIPKTQLVQDHLLQKLRKLVLKLTMNKDILVFMKNKEEAPLTMGFLKKMRMMMRMKMTANVVNYHILGLLGLK